MSVRCGECGAVAGYGYEIQHRRSCSIDMKPARSVDRRNEAEKLLNAAMDHIAGTLEQPTDPRAWGHLLIYCPIKDIFERLVLAINYDGKDRRSITLGEIERSIKGAKIP